MMDDDDIRLHGVDCDIRAFSNHQFSGSRHTPCSARKGEFLQLTYPLSRPPMKLERRIAIAGMNVGDKFEELDVGN